MGFGSDRQKAIKKKAQCPEKVVKAAPSEKAFAAAHGVSPNAQVSAIPPKRVVVKALTRPAPTPPRLKRALSRRQSSNYMAAPSM